MLVRRPFVSVLFPAVLLGASVVEAAVVVTDLGGNQYQAEFTFQAPAGTETVYLAGTFNGWNPRGMRMTGPDVHGAFRATLVLPKGRHEYKFVVDGQAWQTDPDNPHKTDGYRNAIIYAGVEPSAAPGALPASPPVEMAGEVAYPAPVEALRAQIAAASAEEVPRVIARWCARYPMPLFTEQAVSFVYFDADAEDVSVQAAVHGARMGYVMRPLTPDCKGFAVSLNRAQLPQRMAYTLQVERANRTDFVVDPNAWSVTSRGGQPAGAVVEASAKRGRIEVIRGLKASGSTLLPRDVYVYLPPGYDNHPRRRYPVLYMHDGQNCWDDPVEPFGHGGWCVNLTADELINAGKIAPFIGVGVANTADRMEEYGAGRDILRGEDHAYIQFLRNDIKLLIDRRYRTAPGSANAALMGSSMGGIISFQAALLNPEVFGRAACLSPAFSFTDDTGQDYFDLLRKVGKQPVRLYLDSGTAGGGGDGAPRTRRMAALLREIGWQDGVDLLHFEDTGAEHNERAWRARLAKPLVFLFGRDP